MDVIQTTIQFVKQTLSNAEGGHDWFHIERVWKNAKKMAKTEGGDLLVIELASLLHDVADYKFNDGDENIGGRTTENFLESIHVQRHIIDQVVYIVNNISFKGGSEEPTTRTLELNIVQDADRLDALGAIGIARTFNYGGYKGNVIHNPSEKPKLKQTKEEYKKNSGTTINHFHEKLLLLKNRMNTKTGKQLANQRHDFMIQFLAQFEQEWNSEN